MLTSRPTCVRYRVVVCAHRCCLVVEGVPSPESVSPAVREAVSEKVPEAVLGCRVLLLLFCSSACYTVLLLFLCV